MKLTFKELQRRRQMHEDLAHYWHMRLLTKIKREGREYHAPFRKLKR